jgi:hypothetical protein
MNIKRKDFISNKLINFKKFIGEQLNKIDIVETDEAKMVADLEKYSNDVNVFITAIIELSKYKLDKAVELFLSNYNIDINEIKNDIDYDKLCKYLNMFIDVLK